MTDREWNKKAKKVSESRVEGGWYQKNKDSIKNAVKIGTGIGFTGLTLGATLYAVEESSAGKTSEYVADLAFDYSSEITEIAAYSFEAINKILG